MWNIVALETSGEARNEEKHVSGTFNIATDRAVPKDASINEMGQFYLRLRFVL